jgi:hypothetical protein
LEFGGRRPADGWQFGALETEAGRHPADQLVQLNVGVKRLEPVPRSQSNRNFVGGDLVEERKADTGVIAFFFPERLSEKVGLGGRT